MPVQAHPLFYPERAPGFRPVRSGGEKANGWAPFLHLLHRETVNVQHGIFLIRERKRLEEMSGDKVTCGAAVEVLLLVGGVQTSSPCH